MGHQLDEDPRWLRLHDREWICPCCGSRHAGLFDLACDRPDFWQGADEKSPNSEARTSSNVLTEDFCVLDGQHNLYLDTFDEGNQGNLGPWFGWFSNRLQGYPDTLNLKCQVHPQEGRQRPYVELEPTDHPLAIEQQSGITFDRLLEIYALYGHDLRDALSA